jgi:hypothetical protein
MKKLVLIFSIIFLGLSLPLKAQQCHFANDKASLYAAKMALMSPYVNHNCGLLANNQRETTCVCLLNIGKSNERAVCTKSFEKPLSEEATISLRISCGNMSLTSNEIGMLNDNFKMELEKKINSQPQLFADTTYKNDMISISNSLGFSVKSDVTNSAIATIPEADKSPVVGAAGPEMPSAKKAMTNDPMVGANPLEPPPYIPVQKGESLEPPPFVPEK